MSLDDSGAGASETSERASDGLSGGTTRAPRVNASPIAKRIARKRGIDLSGVQGTGPSGMITKDDVERATTSPASAEGGVTEPAPLTRAQQAIARHMVEAAAVPTFSVEVEVEMSACAELRSSLDPQPSYNDLVVKACALALRDHPRVNASYSDGGFRYASEINVGIAVAAEDALLVPVIRQADLRSLAEIRTASRELVERARAGRLTPAELDGGTFTISNLGMHGMRRFEALLNTPQAAILAVGAVEPRPAVGPDAGILVRPLMSATLVCDHRILYGSDAARFLARVRELLEEPSAL